MIPRPPRSTLFPTRRSSDLILKFVDENTIEFRLEVAPNRDGRGQDVPRAQQQILKIGERSFCLRSEEHTSELQSQSNLVCRLLLEKKKITYLIATLGHSNYQ